MQIILDFFLEMNKKTSRHEFWRRFLLYLVCNTCTLLVKPLNVAEVLTMWKLVILWIHTNASLEATSVIHINLTLEGVVITFLLNHCEWSNLLDATVGWILVILKRYEFETNSVIKTLLVDCVLDSVLLTSLSTVCEY